MKRRTNGIFALIFGVTLAALLVIFISSCSRGGKNVATADFAVEAAAEEAQVMMKAAAAPRMAKAVAVDSAAFSNSTSSSSSGQDISEKSVDENTERKLIKTGDISLEVQSLDEAAKAIGEWAAKFGGYVESSYSGESDGNVKARIPSERFDDAMAAAGNLGEVKSQSVSSEDVTERFYDLKTRLETKKVMRGRLEDYLSKAKDMKDLLQIERELNSVVTDIESMEGSMRRLSSKIDYSSITVSYSLPYRADPKGGSFKWPDFGDGFRRFASHIVDFFAWLVKVVLYVVICGIPLLALVSLLFWLLFGKVGLVRRIFRRLK